MVKKEVKPEPVNEGQILINTINARQEALGAYKSALKNLAVSLDTLMRLDDGLLNLLLKSSPLAKK